MSIETALTEIKDDVADVKSTIQDGIPTGATAFNSTNATAVAAEATPQALQAAPGANKRIMVKQAVFSAPTANEVAVLHLQDEDDNVLFGPLIAGKTGAGLHWSPKTVKFNPPLRCPINKALEVGCTGDVGDSYVHVTGYITA
jgi:hypothetical protein